MPSPFIPLNGFRFYSKGSSSHPQPTFQYVMDSGVVWQDDSANVYTGAWRPVASTDIGGAGGVFNSITTGLNGGTNIGTIPAGASFWELILQQGSISFNGTNILSTGAMIRGGGNGGKTLATPITWGCTGCTAVISYDF